MVIAPGIPVAGPAVTAPGLLAGTYRRLTALCEALNVRVAKPDTAEGPRERGPTGADLTEDPETLDAFIDATSARIGDRFTQPPRRHVAATRALHEYVWGVALLMSGAWYLERRVPWIQPRDVRLDLVTGTLEVTAGSGFACLAGDLVAARMPAARVLVHDKALRAELRAAVADHVRPLLTAIAPQVRRGPRALWGLVADDLISGIWYLGRVRDEEERAVRAATALLPDSVPPLPGGADFRQLAGADGRSHLTRTRRSCCLYYTVRPAGEACLTCPRTCDAERLRRLER